MRGYCRRSVTAGSLLALLGTAGLQTRAAAQEPASGGERGPTDSLAELATRLSGQRRVRISLGSQTPDLVLLQPSLVGDTLDFARYVPGAWTLDTTVGEHQILLAEITRLQIRGSAWERGALLGLLVGAGAIEAVNAAGKAQIDRGETVFVGMLFGAGGAVLGGVIAAPFHRWKTVYEAP